MASPPPEALYCVTIRHNLVTGVTIGPAPAGAVVHGDPLAVSTVVAGRMQQHGCIDGDYHFADLSMARHFAGLASDLIGRIAGKTTEALATADVYPDGWASPFVPGADGP
jgi:hypothetical protein